LGNKTEPSCGDGIKPGISREKPGVCKSKENEDEVIKCGDDSEQTRNDDTGVWECPKDQPAKVCGDGLNPGVDREKFAANPALVCKDGSSDDKDETPKCADESDPKRNPDTAKWECKSDEAFKVCGDGLNPGVDRGVFDSEK